MLGGDVWGQYVRSQLELRARHGARVIPPLWERMGRPWEGVWSEKLTPDIAALHTPAFMKYLLHTQP